MQHVATRTGKAIVRRLCTVRTGQCRSKWARNERITQWDEARNAKMASSEKNWPNNSPEKMRSSKVAMMIGRRALCEWCEHCVCLPRLPRLVGLPRQRRWVSFEWLWVSNEQSLAVIHRRWLLRACDRANTKESATKQALIFISLKAKNNNKTQQNTLICHTQITRKFGKPAKRKFPFCILNTIVCKYGAKRAQLSGPCNIGVIWMLCQALYSFPLLAGCQITANRDAPIGPDWANYHGKLPPP